MTSTSANDGAQGQGSWLARVTQRGLPLGFLELDKEGRVQERDESQRPLDRRRGRSSARVRARDFFEDVLHGCDARALRARFVEGLARGCLELRFRCRLHLQGLLREVSCTLFYSQKTRTVWAMLHAAA